MERHKIYSPLTDKELAQKAYWWIEQLIKSNGKDFVMHVPAQLDHDTDLVFFNLAKRFENLLDNCAALQSKCDRYEKALKGIADPIAYQRRKAQEQGMELNGNYAVLLSKDDTFLKSIANEALNGEGDRICPNCNKQFNADRHRR